MQEFILEYIFKPEFENKLKLNLFKCIFHMVSNDLHVRKVFFSKDSFCRAPISGYFCVLFSLWVTYFKFSSFFQSVSWIFLYHRITDVVISYRRPIGIFMFHSTDCVFMWHVATVLLNISNPYINKSYKNAERY